MAQIIQANPTAGAAFGTGLGRGISTGIQALVQQKLEDLTRQSDEGRTSSALRALNIPEDRANALSKLPADVRNLYLKRELETPLEQSYYELASKLLGDQGQQPNIAQEPAPLPDQTRDPFSYGAPKSTVPTTGTNQPGATNRGLLPSSGRLNANQFKNILDVANTQRNRSDKQQDAIDKKNSPVVKDLRLNHSIATGVLDDVARAKEILDSGKFRNGFFASKTPIELLDSNTQELNSIYERLSLSEISKIGRGTDFIRRIVRATKPSIGLNVKAQRAALNRIESFAQESEDKYNAFEDIVNSNNGIEPANLELRIRDYLENRGERIPQESPHIYQPGKRTDTREEEPESDQGSIAPDNEGLLGSLTRNAVANTVNAGAGAASLTGIPGSIEGLFRGENRALPNVSDVQNAVKGKVGKVLPKDYLKPRGTFERGIQNFTENLGLAAPAILTGGTAALIPVAQRAAIAAAGETIGEETIGGPWGKFLGGLTSSLGHRFWTKGWEGLTTFVGRARAKSAAEKSTAYKEAADVIKEKNLSVKSKPVQRELYRIYDEFHGKLEEGLADKLTKNFIKVDKVLEAPYAGAQDIWDKKQLLNSAINSLGEDEKQLAVPFIRMSKVLTDQLKSLGEKVPEFGKAFNKGESYHAGLAFTNTLTKSLQRLDKNEYFKARAMLGALGSLAKGNLVGFAKIAGKSGLQKASELTDYLRSPNGAKNLAESFLKGVQGDIPGLTRSIRNLDRGLNEE